MMPTSLVIFTDLDGSLLNINLISTETWFDLISGEKINSVDEKIYLAPYQSMWISNQNIIP